MPQEARIPEELLLLGYCGLGTAIRLSAILFDDKNLELLRGFPSHECLQSFPQDEETTHKNLHRHNSE